VHALRDRPKRPLGSSRLARLGRRPRLGLRARIIFAFAFGALLLSGLLAALTYGLVRENLVRQRESTATRQLFFNAAIVRDQLRTQDVDRTSLLEGLNTPAGSSPILFDGTRADWISLTLERSRDQIPGELRARVLDGAPARMRYHLDGQSTVAVGVPIPAVGAAYFEIVSLASLDEALESLSIALVAAALVTTLAGASIGAWGSRRVLRPLSKVSGAATAIAGGHLGTRLEPVDDADLAPLVTSFNDMVDALQRRIERDARFASDVSHELRSPLTTLAASIEVLQSRRDEMPERSVFALDLLTAEVQRFSTMVEDLLEISRMDAGVALDREPVRIVELLLHAVSGGGADFALEIDASSDDAVVLADKRRLVRVIDNLIDNARKYGGGVDRIAVDRIALDRFGGVVQVAVEDAGPGVPAEDRGIVFERFSRGSGAGRRSGSEGVGLGLALVHEHVRLHGGRVWVEDRPDGNAGARFVFELPVVDE
jgi:two-component system sensor histidine kinase MtrB